MSICYCKGYGCDRMVAKVLGPYGSEPPAGWTEDYCPSCLAERDERRAAEDAKLEARRKRRAGIPKGFSP